MTHNKCKLMNQQVNYSGGGTYTLGAVLEAQELFSFARPGSSCALFLVTDGFSNGGDPRPVAKSLRSSGVIIFTFGISTGNTAELFEMASTPGHEHSYLLDSFSEFEALARRALHQDLAVGHYVNVEDATLCGEKCATEGRCTCGLRTGHYACLCPPGFYGPALAGVSEPCTICPNGTYNDGSVPGDVTVCMPCPDVNHITIGPATSLADCYCNQGFTPMENGSRCEMVYCPDVDVPENGYMIHGWCSTVMNAGCGIRCNVGYTLVGSSVRLCLPDGTWSGTPAKCIMKRCPRLPVPIHGNLTCTPDDDDGEADLPLDAECQALCASGYSLVGSKKRTCLPLSKWDGLPNSCRTIHCRALPEINNGFYLPVNCLTQRKHEFGTSCKIRCLPGYELHGPDLRKCTGKGSWTKRKEITTCIDVTPPILKCPDDITVAADLDREFTVVTWREPEPTDNSNQSVALWTTLEMDLPLKLKPGRTSITYVATDSSFNQATCDFTVTVLDNEPPTMENCDSEQTFLISWNELSEASWLKPEFYDNSDQELMIIESHKLNELPLGTTNITYTAIGSSGKNVSCTISVIVVEDACEIPNDPLNGKLNCTGDSDDAVGVGEFSSRIYCSVVCNQGFAIATENVKTRYYCDYNDSEFDDIPDCSEIEIPNLVSQEGELSFEPTVTGRNICSSSEFVKKVGAIVQQYLEAECSNDSCTVTGSPVRAECEEYVSGLEERSNKINNERKRRDVPNARIKVKFSLKGKKGFRHGKDFLTRLERDNALVKVGINIQSEKQLQLVLHPEWPICSPGFVLKQEVCVKCPPGTSRDEHAGCKSCPLGWYQPLSGQSECLKCPEFTSTRRTHSRHIRACKSFCLPGTYSRNKDKGHLWNLGDIGVKPCVSCPTGAYQPNSGAISCLPCNGNVTTKHRGSTTVDKCIVPVQNATTLVRSRGSCRHVMSGHVLKLKGKKCELNLDLCLAKPCLHGGTCIMNGSSFYTCYCIPGFTGDNCQEEIDECASSPCLNGGECIDAINEFHCHCLLLTEGPRCDVIMDECTVEPCAEGAKCSSTIEGYRCECGIGFSGRNCEIDPCDVPSNSPCFNNATCHSSSNTTHQSYSCECRKGWSGAHCVGLIDPCASSPCQNLGTCVSHDKPNNFSCLCSPEFYGSTCETFITSDFSLNFPIPGTLDYVKIKGPDKALNEVSLCMWLQSSDKRNYGTLFSYATTVYDNTFTLTDYNGLVLYINGKRVVTDVQVNDGAWHSVCVEWTSAGGLWGLYLDGLLQDSGSGLSNNSDIPGGGVVVIGQEQDRLGGGFNPAEALVGRLAGTDVWDYMLQAPGALRHAQDCNGTWSGNVLAWSELYRALHGNVQIEDSPLCKGCGTLDTPQFSTLMLKGNRTVGSVAVYACDTGYVIHKWGTEVTQQIRKCLKDGSWQGISPTCQRCYCGFPGYFPHGRIIGNLFYFSDSVYYECESGFKLVGPNRRECLATGSWSDETPSCQADSCPILTPPDHGNMWLVVGSSYHMEFECDRGFKLLGTGLLTCLDDGEWDNPAPQCIPIDCTPPQRIDNFIPVTKPGESYPVGSTVYFECAKEFEFDAEMNSSLLSAVCNSTGHWVQHLNDLTCIKTVNCHPLAPVEHGIMSSSSSSAPLLSSSQLFKEGAIMNISCDIGYKLEGSSLRKCQSDSTWSGVEALCLPITCPALLNASIHGNDYNFTSSGLNVGDTAAVQCNDGFRLIVDGELQGDLHWRCGEDGQWHGELPIVSDISWECSPEIQEECLPPEAPEHGYILEHNAENVTYYLVGETFNVNCRQGYVLKGDNHTTCLINGTWSHVNRTLCEAVECPKPSQPPNTELTILSSLKYGSMALHKCLPGYHEFGSFAVHCQANGRWSRTRGRCLRISCGKPEIHPDAEILGESYLYREEVEIVCPPGGVFYSFLNKIEHVFLNVCALFM